jgi:glycosyltransferase involved in cell wall biosynthesis
MAERHTTNMHNDASQKPATISVAMAVYNGGRFLPAMIDSLATQTVLTDELVVCDNCSTDDSRELIEQFARRVPFVVKLYVNERNLGADASFERAFGLCTKEIIFPADCDDVWLPHKLAAMSARFAESDEIGLVLCDRELVDEHLNPLGRTWCQEIGCDAKRHRMLENGRLDALARTHPGGNVMAFRARFRELVLPIEEPWYVSYDQWTGMLIGAVARVAFVAEPLVRFRLHRGQNSGAVVLAHSGGFFRKRLHTCPVARYLLLGPLVLKRLLVTERFQVSDQALVQIADWAAHSTARIALPRAFLPRLAAVAVELAARRYHRYSNGMLSAAKDAIYGGAELYSGKVSAEPWFSLPHERAIPEDG